MFFRINREVILKTSIFVIMQVHCGLYTEQGIQIWSNLWGLFYVPCVHQSFLVTEESQFSVGQNDKLVIVENSTSPSEFEQRWHSVFTRDKFH